MNNLAIPQLYCPFISELNPFAEAVKQHTDQWVQNFSLLSSESEIKKYHSDNYSYFTARFYPYADYKRLCVTNDIFTLLFIIDDQIDSPFGNNTLEKETALRNFIERFLKIINQKTELNEPEENPLFTALKDVWERLAKISSSQWLLSFAKEIEYIFIAAIWEHENSSGKQLPKIKDYLEKRRYIGAANIAVALIEPIEQIYLPKFVKQHDTVKELDKLACNAICISNDLFSLSKEQILGDEHNLPSIIKSEYKTSWEEAILITAEIYNEEIKNFIILSEQLPFFSSETDEILKQYINKLKLQIAGNFIWSEFETERYQFVYTN